MNLKEFKYLFDMFCMLFSLLIPFFETFCVLMYTWMVAYLNTTYHVDVYINNYGEAFPELIMWLILFPLCVYGLALNLRYIVKQLYYYRYHIAKIL